MLSEKVENYLMETGLYDETEGINYQKVMLNLGIKLDTTSVQFNLYTDAVAFRDRSYGLCNVCWFKIYFDDLDYGIGSVHRALKLPDEYTLLDSSGGEGSFFYNRKTGEVLELGLGQKLIGFQSGQL